MWNMIFRILKYSGMFIGSVLLIVLFLILLLLFVPVHYQISAEKQEALKAGGKIYWLFHIVSFQMQYKEEKTKKVLRVFGVPIWKE